MSIAIPRNFIQILISVSSLKATSCVPRMRVKDLDQILRDGFCEAGFCRRDKVETGGHALGRQKDSEAEDGAAGNVCLGDQRTASGPKSVRSRIDTLRVFHQQDTQKRGTSSQRTGHIGSRYTTNQFFLNIHALICLDC